MPQRDILKYETFTGAFREELAAFQAGLLGRTSTDKEWARALSISKNTVRRYLSRAVSEGVISEEDLTKRTKRSEVIEELVQEIQAHQNREISTLKGNEYYAQRAGVKSGNFSSIIRNKLPRPLLDYRATQLRKQTAQRRWQEYHPDLGEVIESVPEEIQRCKQGLIKKLRTNPELAQLAGVKGLGTVSRELKRLVDQGKLTQVDRDYREDQIRTDANLNRHQTNSPETRRKLSEALKGREIGPVTEETRKRISEALTGRQVSEDTREKMREIWAKNNRGGVIWELSQQRYEHEGVYYASKTECATALALEKYIPGYKIVKGETFQVQGDTNCWFDFLLPGTGKIIEWHPTDIRHDGKRLLPFDFWALQEDEQTSKQNEKALIYRRRVLKADLAAEYWMQRQEAVNNSQVYGGNEVIHVRTPGELYDLIISEYGDPEKIPIRSDFVKEFEQLTKEAKPVKK